jgi:hypothetical protein
MEAVDYNYLIFQSFLNKKDILTFFKKGAG